ncbi:MAG: carboxyltransferase domain-containing protein, partial [Planctomycetota bacterium]
RRQWRIGVLYGPHGAPDFFTDQDIATFFDSDYEVHFNSNRTGVRLIGPKPEWARADGGEAGLHPSNIHDNAYAIGAVDFTGDMPIILGPDGPSLGGFVCPAVVCAAERWKLGQLRAGDRVRFHRLSAQQAQRQQRDQEQAIRDMRAPDRSASIQIASETSPVLRRLAATAERPAVCYRPAGDEYLLVEYGPLVLDLNLRFRVHALMQRLQQDALPGLLELTPGVRSLQLHYDPARLPREQLLSYLGRLEAQLPDSQQLRVPTRIVHLPLSWDDPATREAIRRYEQSVRPDAPWCPSNIEFIRRINGLESIEAVRRIVFDASYLVLGLGDVYLGAPLATPLDPRHRLVTTKYNPARTWTPENAVGIGGAYLCIYGMEGPGGYQFVGRTLQVWNSWHSGGNFEAGSPWLLRFFDQIRFHPVSADDLLRMRRDFLHGRHRIEIEESEFDLGAYNRFLVEQEANIATFKQRQQAAFEAERARWAAAGQDVVSSVEAPSAETEGAVPDDCEAVTSAVAGSVWQVLVAEGESVAADQVVMVVESMKMEFQITAPCAGCIRELRVAQGAAARSGQVLAVLEPAA